MMGWVKQLFGASNARKNSSSFYCEPATLMSFPGPRIVVSFQFINDYHVLYGPQGVARDISPYSINQSINQSVNQSINQLIMCSQRTMSRTNHAHKLDFFVIQYPRQLRSLNNWSPWLATMCRINCNSNLGYFLLINILNNYGNLIIGCFD